MHGKYMRKPGNPKEGKYHSGLDSTEKVGFKVGLKGSVRFQYKRRVESAAD